MQQYGKQPYIQSQLPTVTTRDTIYTCRSTTVDRFASMSE